MILNVLIFLAFILSYLTLVIATARKL